MVIEKRKEVRFGVKEPCVVNNGEILTLTMFDGHRMRGVEGKVVDVSKNGIGIRIEGADDIKVSPGDMIEVHYYDNFDGYFRGVYIVARGEITRVVKSRNTINIGVKDVIFNNEDYLQCKLASVYIEHYGQPEFSRIASGNL